MSEKMPWDDLIEKRLETIPEPERDVSTMAWVNFSAFREWLESKDIDSSAMDAADLFPVVVDAVLFGCQQTVTGIGVGNPQSVPVRAMK